MPGLSDLTNGHLNAPGTSFYVSARHFWLLEDKRDFSFIEDVRSRCFMEVVDRAVRAGLERYFAVRNIPLPALRRWRLSRRDPARMFPDCQADLQICFELHETKAEV